MDDLEKLLEIATDERLETFDEFLMAYGFDHNRKFIKYAYLDVKMLFYFYRRQNNIKPYYVERIHKSSFITKYKLKRYRHKDIIHLPEGMFSEITKEFMDELTTHYVRARGQYLRRNENAKKKSKKFRSKQAQVQQNKTGIS